MPIDTIIIAGGGLAGWMTADVFARSLPANRYRIKVIENVGVDDSMGPYVPVLATLPAAAAFHAEFGYAEDEIIRASDGCFSLGTVMSEWADGGAATFHAFCQAGAPIAHVSFPHLAFRLRAEHTPVSLANYSLAALLAQSGRFTRPQAECETVLSTIDYGLMLATAGYADFFKRNALERGVEYINAEIGSVVVGTQEKDIVEHVVTLDGRIAHGDLFIDCTGPAASLMAAVGADSFEDWSQWLPCNRLASETVQTMESPQPYIHRAADQKGWSRFIGLQGTSSKTKLFVGDDDASKPDTQAVKAGRRQTLWHGNVIAMGGAASVIDPLSPMSMTLLQSALSRLVTLFPHEPGSGIEAREFNRQTIAELEAARDFAILPYKLNARVGEPFWDQCRAMCVPDRLARQIALYKAAGRISLYDGDLSEESDWVAMFEAQGIYPNRYDPAADALSIEDIRLHFSRIRELMLREVALTPFHATYLKALCR